MSSNYNAAIRAYDDALKINKIESDYAAFQKAISYGYLDEGNEKVTQLESFVNTYNKSTFRDDALYELGNSYVKRNEIDKAMQKYNQLNAEYKLSPLVSKVLLRHSARPS